MNIRHCLLLKEKVVRNSVSEMLQNRNGKFADYDVFADFFEVQTPKIQI